VSCGLFRVYSLGPEIECIKELWNNCEAVIIFVIIVVF